MSSVDNRIVNMQFNNSQFEKGISQTMSSLDKLKKTLEFKESQKNINDLEKAGNNFSMAGMADTIQAVGKRFSTLGIVGMTAIQNITNKAMTLGHRLTSAIVNPIIQGGKARAENIEQAKFQIEGLGKKWSDVEEDINYGVQDTAYGLDAAARVASQLLASSVKIGKPMKQALRGISGVAAMTNSSYEDIGQIYTAVAGNGRVMASELRRLSLRGINAAATLGKSLGKTEAEIREMTRKGQIDFATFSKAMDDAFGEHAKEANKTFSGAFANMKAALSRTGEKFWTPWRKNLKNIFNSFTPVINTVNDALEDYSGAVKSVKKVISSTAKSIEKTLSKFGYTVDKNGNRVYKKQAKSLRNIVKNLVGIFQNFGRVGSQVFGSIGKAFRDVFPKKNIKSISKIVKTFRELTDTFGFSEDTLDKLRRTFRGFFSIFAIAKNLIKQIVSSISELANKSSFLGSNILGLTANIGDLISKFKDFIQSGNIISNIFSFFTKIIEVIIHISNEVWKTFSNIYGGIKKIFSGNKSKLLQNFINLLKDLLSIIKELSKTILDNIINTSISEAGSIIDKLMAGGVLAAFLSFKKAANTLNKNKFNFLEALTKPFSDLSKNIGSIAKSISSLLNSLATSLQAFSKKVESEALINTAKGIAILTASLFVLSLIDTEKLYSAMTSLIAFMAAFTKIFSGLTKFKKGFDLISASMYIRSIALTILTLSAAVAVLSRIPFEKLENGIAGVSALLGVLTAVVKLSASEKSKKIAKGSIALIAMAGAVRILSSAIVLLSDIPIDTLNNTVSAVSILIGVLTGFLLVSSGSKKMASIGFGLIEMSAAINILTIAIKSLSEIPYEDLNKSLMAIISIIASLTMFVSMASGSKNMVSIGLGLILVSAALEILSDVMHKISDISWEGLSKVGIVLTAFIVGLKSFITIFEGLGKSKKKLFSIGLGLILVNASLEILSDVIKKISDISWEGLSKAGIVLTTFIVGLEALLNGISSKGKNALSVAVVLNLVSLALRSFAVTVEKVSAVDWGGIAKMIVVISTLVASLSAISRINPKGFTKVFIGILLLSTAIKLLSSIGIANAIIAIGTLITTFGAIALGMKILKPFTKSIWKVSKALLFFSVSIASLGVSAIIFGTGLMLIGGGLAAIGAAGYTIVDLIGSLANALDKHGPKMVKAIFNIIGQVLDSFGDLLPKIGNLIIKIVRNALNVFNTLVPDIVNSIGLFVKSLIPLLMKYIPTMAKAVFDFISKILDILIDRVPEIIIKVVKLFKIIFKTLIDAIGKVDPNTFVSAIAAFGALLGIFALMAKASSLIKNALKTGLAMLAVFGVMTGLFLLLNIVGAESVLKMALGLSTTLLTITACMAVISNIPVAGALQGIAGLAIVIAGLTAIIAALGALKQIPGLKWLIDEGAEMLKSIGNAIGGFLGSIIGGFFAGMSEGLLEIADNLSLFMIKLTPFIMGARMLSPELMSGVKALAETILILTGAQLLEGIANWLTGDSTSISQFADDLVALAPSIVAYAEQVKGLDGKSVKASASAAKCLAEVANNLPREDGLLQKIIGKNMSMKTFAEDIKEFGGAMKEYAKKVKGLDTKSVKASASAGKALAKLANNLPKHDGLLQDWLGDSSLTTFAAELKEFGPAIKDYGDSVKGLDGKAVKASARAGKALSGLAAGLVAHGGIVQWWNGDTSLKDFGHEIVSFGMSLSAYADNVAGIDEKKVTASANAGKALSNLANGLESTGGIAGFFSGNKQSLSDFGNTLAPFGRSLASYSNEVKDINSDAMLKSLNAAKGFFDLLLAIDKNDYNGANVGDFKNGIDKIAESNIEGFAKAFSNLNNTEELRKIGATMMTTIADGTILNEKDNPLVNVVDKAANSLISMLVNGINSNQVHYIAALDWYANYNSTFRSTEAKQFTDLGSALINGWTNGLGTKKTRNLFKASVDWYIKQITGLEAKYGNVLYSFGTKLISKLDGGLKFKMPAFEQILTWYGDKITNFKTSYSTKWKKVGTNAINGLVEGLRSKKQEPANVLEEIADDMLNAFKTKLDMHSPSKKLFGFGRFSILGFVGGLDHYAYLVANSANKISDKLINGLSTPVSKFAEYLSEDFSNSPVITPVLDLSNIQNGSSYINGLFNDPRLTLSGLGINSATISGNIGLTDETKLYDDVNVIKEIKQLRSDVSTLSSAMSNLQIVMDTGATVGVLTPGIDKKLGERASLKERGI